jgi:site-specific DNA-methyltransferase (adenine-specific)
MEINKIYCESNLETMARMPDNFVDLVVTSPPYDNLRTYKDDIDKSWGEHIWKDIIKELYRITKNGGVVVWIVNDATINGSESGTSFRQALFAMECGFNLHDTMIYERISPFPQDNRYHPSFEYMFIWSKEKPKTFNRLMEKRLSKTGGNTFRQKDGTLQKPDEKAKERLINANNNNETSRKNIWRYNVGGGSTIDTISFEHPATFPELLVSEHIHSWSNEGDLVYDPFMGSGTTAKMSHIYKRNWIGSEISQEYVDIANKRLQPYLDQQTLF